MFSATVKEYKTNVKEMNVMKRKTVKQLLMGIIFVVVFIIWTVLVQIIDVRPVGVNGTDIGFSTVNTYFFALTGVNMKLYNITDWLGLVPLLVCVFFGVIGFAQIIKRKSLFKVDVDIIILGIYYVIVIMCYLIFETIPINYRPVLINGFMEVSYPSSTTLLVSGVMPTLVFQVNRRLKQSKVKKIINIITVLFSVFMVTGRLVSGVHWFTDIIGSMLLSAGLFLVYKSVVLLTDKEKV